MGIRFKGTYTKNEPSKRYNIYAKEKYEKKNIDTDL